MEIRLVLALCGAALFLLSQRLPHFFVVFAREMANEKTVVPICSAMGFALVLQRSGCDQHLVRLLLRILGRLRPLLIPGGVAIGYLVNTTIVSQSSTAATVGPVLLPVLLANGVSAATAGALLLLGCSMGGELFNPGAVEIVTLAQLVSTPPAEVVRRVLPLNLTASLVALLALWALAARTERAQPTALAPPPAAAAAAPPLHPVKALVPLLPLLLLVFGKRLFQRAQLAEGTAIAAAMLVGVLAAGLSAPRKARELTAAFFEGAGYAYTHVISLIVTATLFIEGLKATGLIERLVQALSHQRLLTLLASVVVPGGLAVASGSGIGPSVAVMKILVPAAPPMGLDPLLLGGLTAVAAQLGRTMSPAAAVVMMCATVSGVPARVLLRRVTLPLLLGAAALLLASWTIS